MSRVFLIVLDSVGCGAAPDAADYGDAGADTLGHIAAACAAGAADRPGLRHGPLLLPNLVRRGLGGACAAAKGTVPPGLACEAPEGWYGSAVETSPGKDTPSGHWEIAGAPVDFAWGYFEERIPCLPASLAGALIAEGGLPGLLGDRHASGTQIIEELGAAHQASGKPIVYTSADSVLQIAAHEESFGLERLYDLCRIARRLVDPLRIGRVIARPFSGDTTTGYRRTANRRDLAMPAPVGNLLDRAHAAGRSIVSLGKIGDIFAHRHTGEEIKAAGNMALFDHLLDSVSRLPEGGLLFANFVDFDSEFGHRRDVPGYAAALEAFDRRLPALDTLLRQGDLVLVTGDHGNDPTFRGSDHTREQVPVLAWGPGLAPRALGRRASFADIGQSLADWLGIEPVATGISFVIPAR